MKHIFTKAIRSLLRRWRVDVVPYYGPCPPDFSQRNQEIYAAVKPYTMTSPERVNALITAVDYLVANGIDGALVECGVWKGGSSMAMALTLKMLGEKSRDLYLYDTFSGMTAPSEADVTMCGEKAQKLLSDKDLIKKASNWCCPLDEVKKNLFSTGYPKEKAHFIEGKVEETIPRYLPEKISLLRLDTDWYESTKHELAHLFPRLQPNGVLIIDDYGYWQGARKAVDEYIQDNHIPILLNRIDHTGRIAVKTG